MSQPRTLPLLKRGFLGDIISLAVMIAIAVICFHFMPSNLSFFTRIIAIMLLVLAIDLVTGFTGIATLGHAALYGAGAYAAGIAAAKFGINDPILMLLIGVVAGAIMGLISSLVILRGHGLSQLVLSIAVVQLAREAANKFSGWTGGSDGLSGISPAPLFGTWRFDLWGRTSYWLAVVLLLVTFFLLRQLVRSPFGKLCQAIRQDPVRVRAMGAPVYLTQVKMYAISGAVAGLGGALSAVATKVVGLDSLSFELSAEAVVMLVLGGTANLFGAMIGSGVFMWFEHTMATINPYHWLTIVGALLVVVVLFAPRGLTGMAETLYNRLIGGLRK
ncbi:Branched-chain amino acid ABC transporter, permease protein [Ketogulonicigenium robustum]|uniref:Branched-chain amino acid ABC transporter, permease protein n=1 Tax=Ketogulonicigenium robustum TaxID=92947 RepID=A0A1W6P183_9RHOB|nr:branched-chain amino acid ABC transporter permease [Ketogulonicigenium robustum]ARO15278.1 Branched-chain amino acid ABC transporter, permease protein [Ketogulonicigenium robustum]